MKRDKFLELTSELNDSVLKIINNKGAEYQTNDDVLSNFKSNASELNLTKYQIWSVYFTKHIKSIISKIKDNPDNPNKNYKKEIEPLKSRIIDAIAYLLFLYAMISEDTPETDSSK